MGGLALRRRIDWMKRSSVKREGAIGQALKCMSL